MIVRLSEHEGNFSILDNGAANDSSISWKAKGILWYLLSKPDDWRVIIRDLTNRTDMGEDGVRSGIKELIDAGYMKRVKVPTGGYVMTDYVVYENPADRGKPLGDNPALLSTEEALSTKEDLKEKDRSASASPQRTIWFPNLLVQNKRDLLMYHNASLKQNERLGLLMDLLFDGKPNADAFFYAAGGEKVVFGLLQTLTHTRSVEFLVDWFSRMSVIPLCPNVKKWRPYFMGAFKKEFSKWSMYKAQQEAKDMKREENGFAALMRDIRGETERISPVSSRPRRGNSVLKSTQADDRYNHPKKGSNGVKSG